MEMLPKLDMTHKLACVHGLRQQREALLPQEGLPT